MPDVSFLPKGVEIAKGNRVVVDDGTFETKSPGIFAGGDAVTGPASVIEAIAAGKKAAISIDQYIKGISLRAEMKREATLESTWVSEDSILVKKPKQKMPCLKRQATIRTTYTK